jgi:hypothetical protein
VALKRLHAEHEKLGPIRTVLGRPVDERLALAFFDVFAAARGYVPELTREQRAALEAAAMEVLTLLRPRKASGGGYALSVEEERAIVTLYTSAREVFRTEGADDSTTLERINQHFADSNGLLTEAGLPAPKINGFTREDLRTLRKLSAERARSSIAPADQAKVLLAMMYWQRDQYPAPVSSTKIEQIWTDHRKRLRQKPSQ